MAKLDKADTKEQVVGLTKEQMNEDLLEAYEATEGLEPDEANEDDEAEEVSAELEDKPSEE